MIITYIYIYIYMYVCKYIRFYVLADSARTLSKTQAEGTPWPDAFARRLELAFGHELHVLLSYLAGFRALGFRV